jgi:hypothetical protein
MADRENLWVAPGTPIAWEQYYELEESMSTDLEGVVHIGVNSEISYFVEVEGETLEAAVQYLEDPSNHTNLEEVISAETFWSVVSKVKDMSIFHEDKSDPIKFYEDKKVIRIFGYPIPEALSTLLWIGIGAAIGFSHLTDNKYVYLLLSVLIPGMLYSTGKLLESNKFPIWGFPKTLPKDLAKVVGTYKLEVVGSGFVQMFIDEEDEELAKKMALAILDLGPAVSTEAVPLTHFISLSELKGIFLLEDSSETRISQNLIPATKRWFQYSLLKYQLIGAGTGAAVVSIPFALFNLFS